MANPSRKKRKRKASVVGAVLKLLFLLLLLSMLAAYIANQVALSSKKAELDTLQEQIDQQKTQNEEMQRILSGDSDDVTEWVARDSYNYAVSMKSDTASHASEIRNWSSEDWVFSTSRRVRANR